MSGRTVCWKPVLCSLLCLLTIGCGEHSSNFCQPTATAGRIEGFVRMGGVPFRATVQAARIAQVSGDVATFVAKVASDGSYAIDVPTGRYVVGLRFGGEVSFEYSASGLRFGDAAPDTLVVDSEHSSREVDFNLASLKIHLGFSADLDGKGGIVLLHKAGPNPAPPWRFFWLRGFEIIQGGALDLVLAGVLPGKYKVEVVVDEEHLWIPGVRDSAASRWIELAAGETYEIADQVLRSDPARIQGRISGAWLDLGLSAPLLSMFSPDSVLVRSSRPVAADGSFDETIYIPGPVKLLVSHDGVDQWIGGAHFADATVFPLDAGRTISGIQFVESGIFMEVTVPYFRLEWARFRLYDTTTSSLAASWLVQYSFDPFLAMPNLRPGTYWMQIEAELSGYVPWAPQWYDRASTPAQATTITIGHEGEVVRIPVVLEKGGTISGLVREVQSVTADYLVYVTGAGDSALWGHGFADLSRGYTVKGLPDGDWKVGVWRRFAWAGYSEQPPTDTVWYPGTTDWQAARSIRTRGHTDVTGIDILMPPVVP